jgi:tRNA pseudouridine(55) synthase
MLYETKTCGETMNKFIERIKEKHNVKKIGYCARLDPMAKGIVPCVVDSECIKINDKLGTDKIYQVKIIFGIQTDTDDPLGVITNHICMTKERILEITDLIIEYLNSIKQTNFNQKYHYFSTKMLNHRRQKSKNVIDNHMVSLYDYLIIGEGIFNYEIWKNKIIKQINLIDKTKNFRQDEIINQWNIFDITELFYIKLSLTVTSGFFIRQLIKDMSDYIKFPLMCYSINRIETFDKN